MSEKMHVAKWTGTDKQRVTGVGLFLPGEDVPVTEAQAERLRGVNDPRYLIDGEPSIVIEEEKAELKGKVPTEKRSQLKDTVKEAVQEGSLPPAEAEIAVASNLKKKGK